MSYRLVIQRRGRRSQVFRLLQPSVVIGRGKGTDLLLPDISVSRHHARLDRSNEDGYVLVDLGSQNGTKVNGQKVREQALQPGDELQIGKFLLSYEFKPARSLTDGHHTTGLYSLEDERTGFLDKVSAIDGEQAHQTTMLSPEEMDAVRRKARLQTHARLIRPDNGEVWRLGTDELRFGKGGNPLDGAGIGGSVLIQWTGSEHTLIRCGGLFFTVTVNGTKITDSKVLQPGDTLVMGRTEFTYTV